MTMISINEYLKTIPIPPVYIDISDEDSLVLLELGLDCDTMKYNISRTAIIPNFTVRNVDYSFFCCRILIK